MSCSGRQGNLLKSAMYVQSYCFTRKTNCLWRCRPRRGCLKKPSLTWYIAFLSYLQTDATTPNIVGTCSASREEYTQPKIPEISFGSTGIFGTTFEGGPFWPDHSFQSVGRSAGPKRPFPFDKTVVPSTTLLHPSYNNNNQTSIGLGRDCATGMYLPLGAWIFRNFKPELLLNGKRPLSSTASLLRAWPQQCLKSCTNESKRNVESTKVWPVSNFPQQHATGCANGRNMYMQQCWVRLHGALEGNETRLVLFSMTGLCHKNTPMSRKGLYLEGQLISR